MDIIIPNTRHLLKNILIILSIIITITFFLSIIKIDKKESIIIKIDKRREISIPLKIIKEKEIGELEIPKINLKKNLYNINSNENIVDKNVTILKESSYPTKMVLAAHSGEGEMAYFNNIIYLDINDEVILSYQGEKRIYQVQSIRNVNKTGSIQIANSKHNLLVLTTCDRNNLKKQIIVNCIEKES